MIPDPQETIVALSSAAGGASRSIVRLSGPSALHLATALFTPHPPRRTRGCYPGNLDLPDYAPLPARLYLWPAPNSYTGQEVVEIHTLGSPGLVEILLSRLLDGGARQAQPGEFTLRAFLAGKLDLTRAEAVLGVIESENRDDLKRALAQLAGGVTRPLEQLRADLLDLLADVEAGLDFGDEDIAFVDRTSLLHRLGKGLALVTLLGKQLEERGVVGPAFRAVLVGRPNVGKSSLFNALAGATALVSPEPGTTRDYLLKRLDLEGIPVELVDTAGLRKPVDWLESKSQELGQGETERAELTLLCVEAGQHLTPHEEELARHPQVLGVATKCDLGEPAPEFLATSAVNGDGLNRLRAALAERARACPSSPLAPSLSRCRHHVQECLSRLRRAHEYAREEDPPELLALELRGALEAVGELAGSVYTDDLLDRIFSRFCIGK
jgi:tRNA modification GTPase